MQAASGDLKRVALRPPSVVSFPCGGSLRVNSVVIDNSTSPFHARRVIIYAVFSKAFPYSEDFESD